LIKAGDEVVATCSDPHVADYILHCLKRQADFEEWLRTKDAGELLLPPRERELLRLMGEGKTTQEIAAVLNAPCIIVRFHKKSILKRLSQLKLSREELSKRLEPIVGQTDSDVLKKLLDDHTEDMLENLIRDNWLL
jgi:hypothetical protein